MVPEGLVPEPAVPSTVELIVAGLLFPSVVPLLVPEAVVLAAVGVLVDVAVLFVEPVTPGFVLLFFVV